MTLYGTIERILFFSEEDGAMIFRMELKQEFNHRIKRRSGCVKVKGHFPIAQEKMPICVEGSVGEGEYSDLIIAQEIREQSLGIDEMTDYMAELKAGLSAGEARLVACQMKNSFFQWAFVPNAEKILCDRSGVDAGAIRGTLEKIRKQKDWIDLYCYIKKHSGNLSTMNRLNKEFPGFTMEDLKKNPYGMIQQAGLPIAIGDSIALENGIDPMCKERIMILVEQAITRRENDGDVCVDLDTLFKTVNAMSQNCEISKPDILEALSSMKEIIKDREYDVYYKRYLHRDECDIIKSLLMLEGGKRNIPWHPEFIDMIEKENGVAFGRQQRLAFSLLKSTGLKILTGGPGTGKTTTVNGLLKYCDMIAERYEDLRDLSNMALSAPSGRASQRMAEATKREASTCHRMIEYAPYGDGEHCLGPNNPIKATVIVIDETSMLDISLARRVLGACTPGMLVLFVGDVNQLQSVGPGAVLQDMIRSQRIPVVQLTDVYRQKGGSPIPVNAKKINEGKVDLEGSRDFRIIQCEKGTLTEKVTEIARELLRELGDAGKIQALSPARRGGGGTYELNKSLQPVLNGGKYGGIEYGNKTFQENDRVIMLSNNYKIGYFNGDVGNITTLNKKDMDIRLDEGSIHITRPDFDDVELAYACTIHKSQGSEYPYCIIALPADKKFMTDRSVLYTGVTRAKKGIYIIYEEDALESAIKKTRQGTRKGCLQQRIEKALPKLAGL